ncbi:MAG TPA: calcium-binding protein [Microvirga sp.]|jgi:Ca2+-binding RTX toxin-like protein|nr:calcium-binding protein [Microvirga sp.]
MAVTTTYSFENVANIDPTNATSGADATSLSNGGVAVTGNHLTHSDASFFDGTGASTGTALNIDGANSAIAQLNSGNVVVVSEGDNQDSILLEITATNGDVVLPSMSLATGNAPLNYKSLDVSGLSNGNFVVVAELEYPGSDFDVRAYVVNSSGTLVSNVSIATAGADDDSVPSVAALEGGGFAVAWQRTIGADTEVWYAVYNNAGGVVKAPTLLDTTGSVNQNPSITALANGGFAIAYEDSGWGGDREITLGRFEADGTQVGGLTNATNNSSDDFAASITELSNGMIAVGSTTGFFSDVTWTLVDGTTGAKLGSSTTGSAGGFVSDFDTSIAAMELGQMGAFHESGSDLHGQILQATRTSVGNDDADSITGDDLRDVVQAGGGADIIRGGMNADNLQGEAGNDRFEFAADEAATGEIIDGGADTDTVEALGNVDFTGATFTSIEEIEFSNAVASDKQVTIRADQIGAGLSSTLLIDGNASSTIDSLRIEMGTDTAVSLAGFTFQQFNTGGTDNDRIFIVGDGDAETIVGSSLRDDITAGGGDDFIDGGLGADQMSGGLGNDTFVVNEANDVLTEAAGQGTDTVQSSISFALADNFENLVLTGADAINGTGNAVANAITGNGATNVLSGGAGDDTLNGGGGVDQMIGGLDNDTYVVDDSADVVTELAGQGTDTVVSSASFSLSAEVEILTLSGVAAINGTGNDLANTMTGNDAANLLSGGLGNDTINGAGGNDTLSGGLGLDTLTGGLGADIFDFNSIQEAGKGLLRDVVFFSHAEGDKIDLSTIDAAKGKGFKGDQDFHWINDNKLGAKFTGEEGELRFKKGILSGDINGDGKADFEIKIVGTLTADDLNF